MIQIISFILNIIVLLTVGVIISDIISFIYKNYIYYQQISPGDMYTYFFWPNKKTTVVIIEKSKGRILYQCILSDGTKGALDYSYILSFYLSSKPLNM